VMKKVALEERVSDEEAGAETIDSIEALPTNLFNSKWTLWYDSHLKKGLHADEYLKSVKQAGTFQNLPTFWSCWNEALQLCNLGDGSDVNYHLFKQGIKPIWEDPKNNKGGKFVIITPRSNSLETTVKQWVSLMLTILLGEWGLEDEICGAVLSVRSWGNVFSIWNRNARNKDKISTLGLRLKEMFEMEHVKYQRHQSKMDDNRKKRYHSDDSGSSDHSSSESEQEKPRMRKNSRVTDSTRNFLRDLIAETKIPIAPPNTPGWVPSVSVALPVTPQNEDIPLEEPQLMIEEIQKVEETLIEETPKVQEAEEALHEAPKKLAEESGSDSEAKNKRRRKKRNDKRKLIPQVEAKTTTAIPDRRIVVRKAEGMPTFVSYGLIALVVTTVATTLFRWVF